LHRPGCAASHPEGSRQEGRQASGLEEAATASMARATGGGRSGWTDLRRPMRGEVAAEWLRFVLFLSLLSSSSTELWVESE